MWSNLALHWHSRPDAVLPEWQRVLRVNGLLMFSTLVHALRDLARQERDRIERGGTAVEDPPQAPCVIGRTAG
ncbi:hypothetical protein [Burkholderia contaminans]|uniref:hypothetical protein n=1 Tax=Burkholderia contaminans TaxID=488447 RepID=UPI001F27B592|nr:hypothetical protein [Burkholderia contaminans]